MVRTEGKVRFRVMPPPSAQRSTIDLSQPGQGRLGAAAMGSASTSAAGAAQLRKRRHFLAPQLQVSLLLASSMGNL